MTVRQSILHAAAALAFAAAPVAAFGQGTEEQQQACTPDALKICSDTIPDIGKTTACMKAHFSQLSPRCQTAFGEATGGAKPAAKNTAKTATRKPEPPRAKLATRAEHREPDRAASHAEREAKGSKPHAEREARESKPRAEREANLPAREAPETVPAQVEGYPPFPSPNTPLVQAPTPTSSRAQIANACRNGLIDSFTCSTTVPALLGGPAY